MSRQTDVARKADICRSINVCVCACQFWVNLLTLFALFALLSAGQKSLGRITVRREQSAAAAQCAHVQAFCITSHTRHTHMHTHAFPSFSSLASSLICFNYCTSLHTFTYIHSYIHPCGSYYTCGLSHTIYLPIGFASVCLHLFVAFVFAAAVAIAVVVVIIIIAVILPIDVARRRCCCSCAAAAVCHCCCHRIGGTLFSIARFFQLQIK